MEIFCISGKFLNLDTKKQQTRNTGYSQIQMSSEQKKKKVCDASHIVLIFHMLTSGKETDQYQLVKA